MLHLGMYSTSSCQEIDAYTFGNGYPFEKKIANQAFRCISFHCLDALEKSKFIDDSTYYDIRLDKYLDSLNILYQTGQIKFVPPRIRHLNFIDPDISPLSFYATYTDMTSNKVFFQMQLDLVYDCGLLKAKNILLVDQEPIPCKERLENFYEYNEENGSKTNISFIPPYPHISMGRNPSPNPKVQRFDLCTACGATKLITRDKKGGYWLNEEHKYDKLQLLGKELICAVKNGKYGIINYKNETLLPFIYDMIRPYSKGYLIVTKEHLQGVYNFKCEIIVQPKYSDIKMRATRDRYKQTSHLFFITHNNKMGVIDKNTELIVPIEYDTIELFYSKYLRVKKNNQYDLFDLNGNVISSQKYNDIDFESSLYSDRIFQFTTAKGKKMLAIITNEKGKYKIKKIRIKGVRKKSF